MPKGQLNVKLSPVTIAQIKALAAQRGDSQANVVSIAIDRMAQAEEKQTVNHKTQWEDVFGRDVSASELIALAEREGKPLADTLREYSRDIWGDINDDEDWNALAAQVELAHSMGN